MSPPQKHSTEWRTTCVCVSGVEPWGTFGSLLCLALLAVETLNRLAQFNMFMQMHTKHNPPCSYTLPHHSMYQYALKYASTAVSLYSQTKDVCRLGAAATNVIKSPVLSRSFYIDFYGFMKCRAKCKHQAPNKNPLTEHACSFMDVQLVKNAAANKRNREDGSVNEMFMCKTWLVLLFK